jgi:hypothetical protein
LNVDSNQYSSINSQVVQISPNIMSSSSTVSHGTTGPTNPPLKSLSVSIQVAHNHISRGSTQTIGVKVSDKSNSSKPVSGAHVDGKVIYASHKETESFSGNTDSKGEMSPSHSWQIGGHSNPGIFPVNVHVSAKGYKPASATTTFNVTAAVPTPQNTTNTTNTTITNTTTTLAENYTSSGGNDNSTSDNNTSTNFNPLIPSTGNFTENGIDQQGQTVSNAGSENITTTSGANENDIISSPTIGGGNLSDTITSDAHHSSKDKDATVSDNVITPPDVGSNNGGGNDGSNGNDNDGGGQDEGSKGGVSHDRSGGNSDNDGGKDKGSSGSSSGE